MKRKLYYLIIKNTKCKILSVFLSNFISVIMKGFYIIFSVFMSSSNKENINLKEERQKLNNFSPKPLDVTNRKNLTILDKDIDLSIIIPAYNAEKTVEQCLDSVLTQNTKYNYEIVITNDGSKDNTQKLIENFKEKYKCINLINQENKGFSGARNTGIENAKGEYFMFLDSDDTVEENSIDNLMNVANMNNASIVVGSFNTIYNTKTDKTIIENKVIKTEKDKPIKGIPGGFPWGKVFKRELFENVRFPEKYLFEDSIMAFLIYPLAQGTTVASISDSVYNYYKNDSGITATYSTKPKCIDAYWIIEKMYDEYIKVDLPQNENLFNLIFGHLKITFWRTYRLDKNLRKAIFILSCDLIEKVIDLKPNKKYNLYEKNLLKAYKTRNFKLWNMTSLIMD